MVDMFVTSGMVQSILTKHYLDCKKKIGFLNAVIELYKNNEYLTFKPDFSQKFIGSYIADDKFIDILNSLPIYINNLIECNASIEVGESDIFPDNRDIFVFKHLSYLGDQIHSHNYFEVLYIFKGYCTFQFEKEQYILNEGDLCIIAPKSLHNIIVDDIHSSIITISIRKSTFDTAFFTLLSQKDLLSYFFRTILYTKASPNYLLFHTKNSIDIKYIIKNLVMENHMNDTYYNNCSISWVNILFSKILRNYSETVKYYNYTEDNDFSLILQYMQHNYRMLSLISKEIHANDLYISEDITELNARLKYLQETRGIGLIIGEAGSGKSTALRRYTESLNRSTFKVCYFALSTLTVREFYQALAMILGETPAYKKVTLFSQIQRAITELYYSQKITPVIILDEIQLVSNDVLEDLRIIFNFNMDSQNPYILILSGQPHIRNKLALNVNSALRQRIAIKYVMQGLKKEEIQDYIKTRMKIAGVIDDIFTPPAYEAIYSITKGLPRLINNLVTASLLYAYSKRQREIDEEVIYQAQNEISL